MNEIAKNKFNNYINIVNKYLEENVEIKYPEKIYESMRYSLLAGGKRLRPVIAIETASLFNIPVETVLPAACAIEMLHCQSLIHDDLPCMDDDDFRRGKPSNHKVYGEATAVLAGDALLSYAPQFIIEKTPKTVSSEILINILHEFFKAAGVDGIISGQIVDLDSEKKQISKETLSYLYEYKTAKLFKLAVRIGALFGHASENLIENLTMFAQCYGHAFQIYDDILDVTSTLEKLGKTPGKDEKSEKSTYVSMFGMQESKNQIMFLCSQAYDILNSNMIESDILKGIVSDIVKGVKKCS